ncbi:MAG: epimerase, partial [Bacteroidetes bacterium]
HPGDVPHTWADISRAKRLLGYRPSVSFRDGVQAFLEWMERELV